MCILHAYQLRKIIYQHAGIVATAVNSNVSTVVIIVPEDANSTCRQLKKLDRKTRKRLDLELETISTFCDEKLRYAHLGTPHEPNFGHPQLFLGWDSQLGVNRAFVQNFILNTMVFVFRASIQIILLQK